jgi:hypothetical protein
VTAVVVVLAQVGSWTLLGRPALMRHVGQALPVDFRRWVEANRVRVARARDAPLEAVPRGRVLFSAERPPVDLAVVDAGKPMWSDLDVDIEVDPAPAGSPAFHRCVDSEDCLVLLVEVSWNTPLYAEVWVTDFRYGSNEATWRYRYVWCLGAWLPISRRLAGMG